MPIHQGNRVETIGKTGGIGTGDWRVSKGWGNIAVRMEDWEWWTGRNLGWRIYGNTRISDIPIKEKIKRVRRVKRASGRKDGEGVCARGKIKGEARLSIRGAIHERVIQVAAANDKAILDNVSAASVPKAVEV